MKASVALTVAAKHQHPGGFQFLTLAPPPRSENGYANIEAVSTKGARSSPIDTAIEPPTLGVPYWLEGPVTLAVSPEEFAEAELGDRWVVLLRPERRS